jgi:hypothetical protein
MSSAGAWVNIKNDQFGVVTTAELPCFLQIHGIVGFILGEHRDFTWFHRWIIALAPRILQSIQPDMASLSDLSVATAFKPWGTYSRFGERHFLCPCYLGIQSSVPSSVQVPHADHLGYWAMGLLGHIAATSSNRTHRGTKGRTISRSQKSKKTNGLK